MNRLDAMRDRLPPVWNATEGTISHGLMALIATWAAAYDEDMDRVRRSHWVDTAFDMGDLVKIGALFQIAPAPWETESLYRIRLKATIAARLRGAVSRDVLEFVLTAILGGAQVALGSRYADMPATAGQGVSVFHTGPDGPPDRPAFVEFPLRRRRSTDLLGNGALRRPLARIKVNNTGLFPTVLQGVLRGVAGRKTAVPLIANLTSGQVMVYSGVLACGQSLLFGADEEGTLTASHDGRDVRDHVFTGSDFEPGVAFTPILPDPDPQPLRLERGENELWVFPLALYDQPGLGTGVFAMPDLDLTHGRYAGTDEPGQGGWVGRRRRAGRSSGQDATLRAGQSGGEQKARAKALYEQDPAFSFDLWWDEQAPATFRFLIPAGVVRREADQDMDALTERTRLFSLMQETLATLRAAGTDGKVVPRPFRETQGQTDRVTVLDPAVLTETQPLESRLAALSAIFDLSATDGARFE